MPDSLSTRNAPSELFEGAYYSIIDGDDFSIAKVLKIEPEIVHVRIYKQHFSQRSALYRSRRAHAGDHSR